jgi:hypothetical protein
MGHDIEGPMGSCTDVVVVSHGGGLVVHAETRIDPAASRQRGLPAEQGAHREQDHQQSYHEIGRRR